MAVQNYRELISWQKAVDLVELIYQSTREFPADERLGLTNQMRCAAGSIPSNIAEGQSRESSKGFIYFLRVAVGSLQEVETQCISAHRLNYLPTPSMLAVIDQAAEVARIIYGLIRSILPPSDN